MVKEYEREEAAHVISSQPSATGQVSYHNNITLYDHSEYLGSCESGVGVVMSQEQQTIRYLCIPVVTQLQLQLQLLICKFVSRINIETTVTMNFWTDG